MKELELRAMIAARLGAGILPSERPTRTYAGPGEGATCDCCGIAITERDVQFEVDFATSAEARRSTFVAHRECHRIWQQLSEAAMGNRTLRRTSPPTENPEADVRVPPPT